MDRTSRMALPRRTLLTGGVALATTAILSGRPRRADAASDVHLIAGPAQVPLRDPPSPATAAWAYNGSVPGPTIRVPQGDAVRITVENRLPEDTTVHWHGV